jgi:hypothetical protein
MYSINWRAMSQRQNLKYMTLLKAENVIIDKKQPVFCAHSKALLSDACYSSPAFCSFLLRNSPLVS